MRFVLRVALGLGIGTLTAAGPAAAQVPPHTPGTICFTASFWCWASPPGSPGSACSCPAGEGTLPGTLG